MSAARMAEFLERLGHRVIVTPGAWWYDARTRFYLNFPHHRLIQPDANELAGVFRRWPLGVRYFAPADTDGPASYALVRRGRDYNIDALSANTRSKTRRGL